MALYDTDTASPGSLVLRVGPPGSAVELDHFIEYDYHEDFLTPADGGEFIVDEAELTDQDKTYIIPGARVEIAIDDQVQCVGYLDEIKIKSARGSGTTWSLPFRQWISPAVDCHVDPGLRLASSMSLADMLQAVFASFGATVFSEDNYANRNAITGAIHGQPNKAKKLKSYLLHTLKPYDAEGAFAFASRISQRFGLWIWAANDGETIIVSKPDFSQDSRYQLYHKSDTTLAAHNNVLSSDVIISRKDQPTMIFATSPTGGGSSAKGTAKGAVINPLIVNGSDLIAPIAQQYPSVPFAVPADFTKQLVGFLQVNNWIPIPDPNARPLFLKDGESHTKEQLNAFLLRELSLRMRHALTAQYVIEGHKLNGQPICVDTMIDVDDDYSNLHLTLWILQRRFQKAAGSSGTTTTIHGILPGTLVF